MANPEDDRLRDIEQRLDSVEERLDPKADATAVDEAIIVDLLTTQGKIAAIKEYRLRTGAQLKDSKEAVEEIARRHGVEIKSGSPAGCFVAVLVAALAAGMAYFLMTGQ